ncbi:MAG: response regulator [Anaerolineae bacterium]|nr:response regulator [Anaerolineae bacterium]
MSNVVLKPEGYVINMARNGLEGMASVLSYSPDLIVTDYAMPDMNGLKMVDEIRQAGYDTPVILITAEGSENIAVEALRRGIMDYFVKPFDPLDMLESVRRILGAARVGAVPAGIPDQQRLKALNLLLSIGKSITALQDVNQIYNRLLEAAVYLAGAEAGLLMLTDQETGELVLKAVVNMPGEQIIGRPVSDQLARQVLESGRPVLIDPDSPHQIKTNYLVNSLLYSPITNGDKVVGVLNVHNRVKKEPISSQDIGSIASLIDFASVAIRNVSAFSEVSRERAYLERVVHNFADAVFVIDAGEKLQYCNPAACALLGFSPDAPSPLGQPVADINANPSILDILKNVSTINFTNLTVDIGERKVHVRANRIAGIGYVLVIRDVTHLLKPAAQS